MSSSFREMGLDSLRGESFFSPEETAVLLEAGADATVADDGDVADDENELDLDVLVLFFLRFRYSCKLTCVADKNRNI